MHKVLQDKYITIARAFAEKFKTDSNIKGITLNGGVARGTGDEFSEIDIHFYVTNKESKELPPNGDITINGVWFDITLYEIKKELKESWSMDKRWDASSAKILWQRDNVISDLLKSKVKFEKGEHKKIIDETLFKAGWCVQLAELFIERKELHHGHLLINESLNAFIDYYFLKQRQFIPYYKWKYYYFEKLHRVSNNVKKAIFETYKVKEYSEKELLKRISTIKEQLIKRDLKEDYFPYQVQKTDKIEEFLSSIKKEIRYGSPW